MVQLGRLESLGSLEITLRRVASEGLSRGGLAEKPGDGFDFGALNFLLLEPGLRPVLLGAGVEVMVDDGLPFVDFAGSDNAVAAVWVEELTLEAGPGLGRLDHARFEFDEHARVAVRGVELGLAGHRLGEQVRSGDVRGAVEFFLRSRDVTSASLEFIFDSRFPQGNRRHI